jgi:predicted phage baseplate assembly protein
LGVKSVINPLSPTGADDPETLNSARQNAPLTTLTMDRIVSLRDYEDFTRAFGGIGKVRADYLWKGEQKVVHLTIASANGKGVDMNSDLCENLITAIDQYRDSNIPVSIDSFGDKKFDVKARILIEHKYLVDEVLKAAIAALKANFSFQTRAFGQGVYPAEVISAIQGVLGVIAVDLDELDGKNPFEKEYFYLSSGRANWDGSTIVPAELLIINPDGISIEEMKV